MVRVFISQPMAGRPQEEIEAERRDLLQYTSSIVGECTEVPSYFGEVGVVQMSPLECLGKSIELMAHADVAVFAPGWEDARGCRIEHACAKEYGVSTIIEMGIQ